MTMKRIAALAASLCLAAFAGFAQAQKFPAKPVTVIVPWPAGGSTDLAIRAMAESAAKHLGQPVVIENKPGAAGTLGAAFLAQNARPDGYTLAQIPITVFRYPHMRKQTWDPMTDLTYVIHLTGYTFGVVVRADSPFKTFKELVEHAKANPGKMTYATPGHGTSLHIGMEEIARRAGVQWVQVPFKGFADGSTALLGGHVDMQADSTGWAELVNAGKLRLLVTWGAKRTARWPGVPTLTEEGYPLVFDSPYGLAGPKGMDPAVVKALHDAFKASLDDPGVQAALVKFDQQNAYLDSAAYAAHAKKIYEEEREIVKRLGLK